MPVLTSLNYLNFALLNGVKSGIELVIYLRMLYRANFEIRRCFQQGAVFPLGEGGGACDDGKGETRSSAQNNYGREDFNQKNLLYAVGLLFVTSLVLKVLILGFPKGKAV